MWIVATIMLLAILEVLDSTIVNVALPSMMTSLGATQNQITWVLTSYVVASAVVLPITGFLMHTIGRRRFLLLCAGGFMVFSFFCGAASSLAEIVFFRILQGAFGASLIPVSQTILRESFPPSEQGKAMAIWGLGILVAPVLGPTLGGYITEYSTWRWVFYINLPFCILGILMVLAVIPAIAPKRMHFDFLGLFLMVVGVACLQVFLDKAGENGWFDSSAMLLLFVIAMYSLVFLVWRCLRVKHPIIQLSLYRDRNFLISSGLMMLFAGTVFSYITVFPLMLENFFGYSTIQTGLLMSPLGLSSALGMGLASQLMQRYPVKYFLVAALCFIAVGFYQEMHLSLQAGSQYFITANAAIGLGMGLVMVPLSTYVFSTLPVDRIADASGLFSYARMLGTSIGTALVSTFLSHMSQVNWHAMAGAIHLMNPALPYWLSHQHMSTLNGLAVARLSVSLAHQSGFIAFIDTYRLFLGAILLQIPLALGLKTVKFDSTIHH